MSANKMETVYSVLNLLLLLSDTQIICNSWISKNKLSKDNSILFTRRESR